jgi:hemoglobin
MPQPAAAPAPEQPIPGFEQIEALVDRFYDRIQIHPELGPVFNAAVQD